MKKTVEHRKHAAECRTLARKMAPGEQRDQLLKMAHAWDALANERDREATINSAIEAVTKPEPAAKPGT